MVVCLFWGIAFFFLSFLLFFLLLLFLFFFCGKGEGEGGGERVEEGVGGGGGVGFNCERRHTLTLTVCFFFPCRATSARRDELYVVRLCVCGSGGVVVCRFWFPDNAPPPPTQKKTLSVRRST